MTSLINIKWILRLLDSDSRIYEPYIAAYMDSALLVYGRTHDLMDSLYDKLNSKEIQKSGPNIDETLHRLFEDIVWCCLVS